MMIKGTQLLRRLLLYFILGAATTTALSAQDFELTPFFGGRFGGGVPVTPFTTEDNFLVAGVETESSWAYGLSFDAGITDNFQLELLWSRHDTTLKGTNAATTEKVDLIEAKVDQYHFNLLYQAGEEDDGMRPYILAGAGASRILPGGGLKAETFFSFGFGGGVKLFFTENFGLRIQGRWAPTYIGKDQVVFCTINGCFESDVRRTLNQGELTAGFVVRF
jgi:hypothetical protein